jgi:DNA-binding Lrp family transcriptional regulator
MRKPGGREASHSQHREYPLPEAFGRCSSSPPDRMDSEILSLIGDRPMTALKVAEKMDMSFIECLARIRKLWVLNLLERIDAEPEENGLYRYSAAVKKE